MLLYFNRGFLRLIFAKSGSIFGLNIMVAGVFVAAFTFVLAWLIKDEHRYQPEIPHHYGIMVIGSIASFALVYRTNLGWQRYWEAMTQQHYMYSKWSDTFAQFYAFATVSMAAVRSKGGVENEVKASRLYDCIDRVERNFSLLSAFAAHRLTHGDNERMEQRTKVGAKWSDRLVLRRDLRVGEDLTAATAMPTFSTCEDEPERTASASTNINDAWTADFRVLRSLSAEEWSLLAKTKDRVSAVMYWIIHDLAEISSDMVIAPPIQSRMYQELSNGMLGFNNSLKIADVPFPFPYAQLLTWILVAFSCLIPFYVAVFTTSPAASTFSFVMAPTASFVAFVGMWSINEVAIELENPFGSDDNDISCWDFHERFIEGLLEQRGVHDKKISEQARVIRDGDSRSAPEDKDVIVKTIPPSKDPAFGVTASKGPPNVVPSAPSPSPAAAVAEVCDRQLAEITSRIEQRLALILRELEAGSHAGNPAIIGHQRSNDRLSGNGASKGLNLSPVPHGPPPFRHTVQSQLSPLTGDAPCSNRGESSEENEVKAHIH